MRNAPRPMPATRIAPGGFPIRFEPSDGATGVLLIHGFTGYPAEMRCVLDALAQRGFAVHALRLPGHGTDGRDFLRTGWRLWLAEAMERFVELRSRYQSAFVCGLSMGGVLAALVAERLDATGLVMLAPAFRVANPLVPLTPLLQHVVPPIRKPVSEEYESEERQYYADTYWRYQWPKQTASLYRLMRLGRRALPNVRCPALTIVSTADETVPASVVDTVTRLIGSDEHDAIRLEQSGHVLTMDRERDAVATHVADFVARIAARESVHRAT